MRRVTAVLAACGLMCAGLAPSSASAQLLPLPLPGLNALPGLGGGGLSGIGSLLGGLPILGGGGSGSGSGSGSLPGLGGLMSLFPNPPSCGFSLGWSGIGAGCQPPTAAQPGAAGFLGGLFPNPPSCSAGISWQGLSGGCVPGSPPPNGGS